MKNIILGFLMGSLLLSCSTTSKKTVESPWTGDNEQKINAYLQSKKQQPAVAIFDWDNTVAKNDVGDAMMMWMVKHHLLKKPSSWKKTSQWLSGEALKELESLCSDFKNKFCSDSILSIYVDGVTLGKKSAWKESYNKNTMEPAYAWLASLFEGFTPEEIRLIAVEAINSAKEHSIDGTSHYLRVYPQMKKLISDLKAANVDVWIVSASPQAVVEVFGKEVGMASDRVIGIRNIVNDGKYTGNFEGCGSYRDGNQQVITFRQGKRCWINKHIFGMKNGRDQMEKRSPISFGAGDSDTDIFFLKDAHDLHIVINRNKPEVMCHAYNNKDGKWVVNPMFIEPMAVRKETYNCSKFGLRNYKEN